jgi:transposase-like protein
MSAAPGCPFCESDEVTRVGQWGGQIITSQWRCEACNSYFEAIRSDFDDPAPAAPPRDRA